MSDHRDAAPLTHAALTFVRNLSEAARDSQLRPTFLAWNTDGFVDFATSSQVLHVAVQHSGIHTFAVSTADLLNAGRGDPSARSSINQILQRIIAKLANEVARRR